MSAQVAPFVLPIIMALVTYWGKLGVKGNWQLLSSLATGLVVGGVSWKPAVVERRIEPREILNLTVTFDHDMVDGGAATRLVRRLVELIEGAHGLRDLQRE